MNTVHEENLELSTNYCTSPEQIALAIQSGEWDEKIFQLLRIMVKSKYNLDLNASKRDQEEIIQKLKLDRASTIELSRFLLENNPNLANNAVWNRFILESAPHRNIEDLDAIVKKQFQEIFEGCEWDPEPTKVRSSTPLLNTIINEHTTSLAEPRNLKKGKALVARFTESYPSNTGANDLGMFFEMVGKEGEQYIESVLETKAVETYTIQCLNGERLFQDGISNILDQHMCHEVLGNLEYYDLDSEIATLILKRFGNSGDILGRLWDIGYSDLVKEHLKSKKQNNTLREITHLSKILEWLYDEPDIALQFEIFETIIKDRDIKNIGDISAIFTTNITSLFEESNFTDEEYIAICGKKAHEKASTEKDRRAQEGIYIKSAEAKVFQFLVDLTKNPQCNEIEGVGNSFIEMSKKGEYASKISNVIIQLLKNNTAGRIDNLGELLVVLEQTTESLDLTQEIENSIGKDQGGNINNLGKYLEYLGKKSVEKLHTLSHVILKGDDTVARAELVKAIPGILRHVPGKEISQDNIDFTLEILNSYHGFEGAANALIAILGNIHKRDDILRFNKIVEPYFIGGDMTSFKGGGEVLVSMLNKKGCITTAKTIIKKLKSNNTLKDLNDLDLLLGTLSESYSQLHTQALEHLGDDYTSPEIGNDSSYTRENPDTDACKKIISQLCSGNTGEQIV